MTVRQLIQHLNVLDQNAEVMAIATPESGQFEYRPVLALVTEHNGVHLIATQSEPHGKDESTRWKCWVCGYISHGHNKPSIPCFRCGRTEWIVLIQ